MLPFTEHETHTCILTDMTIDGLSAQPMEPPSSPFLGRPIPCPCQMLFLLCILCRYAMCNNPSEVCDPLPESPYLCTYCYHYGHSIWHCDVLPNEPSVAPCTPETTPESFNTACQPVLADTLVLSHTFPKYFLVWWVLLLLFFRLMVPRNPSQTIIIMMKAVSTQITGLQLDNTLPWIY